MPLIRYRPTTPSRRGASVIRGDVTERHMGERKLTYFRKSRAGRNARGVITVRHRGGARRRVRIVDFLRTQYDAPATVLAIAYDPNRNARLALLRYASGVTSYIIAPLGLEVGATVVSSRTSAPIRVGNRLPLEKLPIGTLVHAVEIFPGQGGKFARGAGVAIQLMAVDGPYAHLKLPSGEIRMVPRACAATIGQVGNTDARLVRYGKAGRMRKRGIRPTVRGKAMNPVDHPHGGGEGNTSIGLPFPKTPWGRHALGVRTRNPKKQSNAFILQRRRK